MSKRKIVSGNDGNHEGTPKSRRTSLGSSFVCLRPECGLSFRRQDLLDRHEFHHTGVKKHFCLHEGCNKSYTTLTILRRHMKLSHEKSDEPPKSVPCKVEDCKQTFRSVYNMLRHIREVHDNPKIYYCKYCHERFNQKLKLRRHEIIRHTGVFPYKCLKCSKGFYQKYTYQRHIPVCQVYECPRCDLVFNKWSVYRKHCIETQHGRTYYECQHCKRLYKKPGELKRHIMIKHTDDKNQHLFKCPEEGCNRSYAYERNLNQHKRVAHSNERFVCSENDCKKEFTSAQNLTKHKLKVHSKGETKALPTKKKAAGKRKKRKDAGVSKMSTLASVSNLAVDKQTDGLLRRRDDSAMSDVAEILNRLLEKQLDEDCEVFCFD